MSSGPIYSLESTSDSEKIIDREEAERLRTTVEKKVENIEGVDSVADLPQFARPAFRFEVLAGKINVAHDEGTAKSGNGDSYKTGKTGSFYPFGSAMYASPDKMPAAGDAQIRVRMGTFGVDIDPPISIFSAGQADTSDTPVSGDGEVQLGNDGATDVGGTNTYEERTEEVPRAPEAMTVHVEGDSAVSVTVTFENAFGGRTNRVYSGSAEVFENVAVPVTSLGAVEISVSDDSSSSSNNAAINAAVK